MRFSKNPFFAFIVHRIYFSECAQLIAEVAESQFLLLAFLNRPFWICLSCIYFYLYSKLFDFLSLCAIKMICGVVFPISFTSHHAAAGGFYDT